MNNSTLLQAKRLLKFRSVIMITLFIIAPFYLSAQLVVKPAKVANVTSPLLPKIFKKYSLYNINTKEIKDFAVKNGTGFSDYDFEFEGYPSFPVSVYQNDILTEDYQSMLGKEGGNSPLQRPAPMTYAGSLKNEAGSQVYLTITNNLIFGYFSKGRKQYYIEPLRYFEKNADRSIYIVYDVADVIPNSGRTCGVTEAAHRVIQLPDEVPTASAATGTCRLLRMGIASDLSMLNKYQSASDLEERNIGIMNIMNATYANAQFGTQYLEFRIAGQYFSTSSATEPFSPLYTGRDANTILSNFTTWGQARTTTFRTYALNQLWTVTDIGVESPAGSGNYSYSVVGLAFIGVVCSNFKYQINEDFTSSSAVVASVATHETGHNLSAVHDASGAAFIMAPSISNPPYTVFSSASITTITNYLNTSLPCLVTCTPVSPVAIISQSTKGVCVGSSATFTDNSTGSPTTRSWSFPGGTPSTSTAASVSVSYATTGLKTVYLTVTNAQGSATTIKNIYVTNAPVTSCRTVVTGNSQFGLLMDFKLADINHDVNTGFFGTRYTNNSCLENTRLATNTTYTVTGYIGFPNGTTSILDMFIDYNNDGDFFDANEVVYNTGTCTNDLLFTFTTPAVVPVTDNFLRLRIVARPCTLPALDGCTSYTNCNVEDYAVYFPSTPCYVGGFIDGAANVCALTNNIGTYTIDALNQTSVAWTVPTGATILSGQGSRIIQVQFGSGFTAGEITASLEGCGSQNTLRSLSVFKFGPESTVGNISGDVNLCNLQNVDVPYSIPEVQGATYYEWAVTNGGIVSGQGTRNVLVRFFNLVSPTTVSVTISGCGTSNVVRTINMTPAYTIQATAASGGTIQGSGFTINCPGSNRTFTISPAACKRISDVRVDGVSQGPLSTYTFTNITAPHTIIAFFENLAPNQVVLSSNEGGRVIGSLTISCNATATYNITPNDCYQISNVIINGVSQGAVSTVVLSYGAATQTISAVFALQTYAIAVTQTANGLISPSSNAVGCGSNATYTITPNSCYDIADVIVDGVSQGAIGSYPFNNVREAHTITASYVLRPISITANAGANGTVSGTTGNVICGSNSSYSFIPDACYRIDDVVVDGVSVGAVPSYTFTNIQVSHTISVTFTPLVPLSAPAVTGFTNVCPYIGNGSQVTYTASSATATNYSWNLPPNVNLVSNNNNSITVTFNAAFATQANKQIRVIASNSCYTSAQTIYYLASQFPSTPASIVASANSVCQSLANNTSITFTIPKAAAASGYIWSAQSGTTNITHTNGPGVNDTTITVTFNNQFTTSAITVRAVNDCGSSGTRSITITKTNPSTPGLIAGATNVCANMLPNGTAGLYRIRPVNGATSYNWAVSSPDAVLTHLESGAADTIVSILFPANFMSGAVTVSSTNGCGTSGIRSLSLTRLFPSTPGNIDVIQSQNCPEREYTYAVPTMPSNTTFLNWTIPADGIILEGQGTRTIRVSYPTASVTGVVTVQSLSNCGNSVIRSVGVKLAACASQIFTKGLDFKNGSVSNSLKLNVYPNPTVNEFRIQVAGGTKEKVNMKITDLQGRVLKQLIASPDLSIQMGNDLKPGAYILEVRQGRNVKMERILKLL